jgi:membrane-associated phospholipid phosphatase
VSPALIVLLCGVVAAGGAFAVSASRRIEFDPIDPAVEERAVAGAIARRPRLARFLRERVARESAGGLLLTVGFLVVLVVAVVFGALLDMIDDRRGLAELDDSVSEWGAENATSATIDALEVVTHLGGTTVVIVVLAGVATYDYVGRRQASVFAFVAVVGAGQLVLTNILKVLIDRDRPNVFQLVETSGASFPSGHSAAAAACWAAVALVIGRNRPRLLRAGLAGAAVMLAIAVATSRALLGVHWVTDIVAGLTLGWGWFLLVAVAFGGRTQLLGDPVQREPAGLRPQPGD